jgi:hypothetical protein
MGSSVSTVSGPTVGRVLDHRGRSCELLDPYPLWLARRFDRIPAEALEPVVREMGFGLARGHLVLFWVGLACLAIVAVSIVDRTIELWLGGGVTLLGMTKILTPLLGVLPGPLLLWLAARKWRLDRTRTAMLRHLRCPHFAYDLRGLPRESDGATICPECGLAWKLDSAGTPEPSQAGE